MPHPVLQESTQALEQLSPHEVVHVFLHPPEQPLPHEELQPDEHSEPHDEEQPLPHDELHPEEQADEHSPQPPLDEPLQVEVQAVLQVLLHDDEQSEHDEDDVPVQEF